MLVADMFTEPNAEKRFTLAQVVERAGRKGLRFSSGQISEVRAADEGFALGGGTCIEWADALALHVRKPTFARLATLSFRSGGL